MIIHVNLVAPSACSRCGNELEDGEELRLRAYKRDVTVGTWATRTFDVTWEHRFCEANTPVMDTGS